MIKQRVVKVRIIAAASLLALASLSAPARADHGHDYVAPLAAFIAFGALLHHSHHRHHYRQHRYYGHGHGHGHGHGYGHKRRHSYSIGRGGHGGHGGHGHKKHHKKHRNW